MAQQRAVHRIGLLPRRPIAILGGWSPRLTPADLAAWPKGARDFLTANYPDVEFEIGVQDKADYLSGPLNTAINTVLQAASAGASPIIPDVTVNVVEEAPIAVQASAPGPGLFSFDKFSSGPMLLEGIRDDIAVNRLANLI